MSSALLTTLNFTEISKSDYPKVGLKAAYMGEMVKARIPVPVGFVITAESYFYFLDMARIREKIVEILASLDVNNAKELQDASNLIQDIIMKATIPPVVENAILKSYSKLSGFVNTYVSIRSSIAYDNMSDDSFAGMSSTFLNIKGAKDVLLAVKACWASMFEPNAIYYRAVKDLSHMKVGMAVIIQKMIQAEVSGVMFTINPIQSDQTKVIIEAVLGLGDIIEADALTPDHYEVSKTAMKIEVKRVAKQDQMVIRSTKHNDKEEQIRRVEVAQRWQNAQKLDDKKIIELGNIGKVIEQHFGEPQDIEWVMEGGKVYILQARSLLINEKSHISELEQIVQEEIAPKEEVITPVAERTIPQTIEKPEEPSISSKQPEEIKHIPEPHTYEQIILSGSPASEGSAQGYVKIIKNATDFAHLMPGDILVIDKIIPDYVLWMKKAAGIITNEGGMTSHAAIISREFKIPCIVGTENATEMLSDHQYIRMNGTNGRVYEIDDFKAHDIQNAPLVKQSSQTPEPVQSTSIQVEPHILMPSMPEVVIHEPLPENRDDFALIHETSLSSQMQVTSDTPIKQPPVLQQQEQREVTFHKNIKTATKVFINLSLPESASAALEKEPDGIGYVNGTDILNTIIKKHPEVFIEQESIEKYVAEIANVLEELCKEFHGKTVIYRPSNLNTAEFNFDTNPYETTEKNPKLGYNGAHKYIENPSLFNLELEAIKLVRNKAGYKNLSLMLPLIRDTRDLREIKKIVTSNDLKRSSTFKVYLPVESPSTVLLINQMIEIGIDGIFIFARELSGFLSAVDLDNTKYKKFNIFNDAFMLAAETIIKTAHKHKIHAGILLEGQEFDDNALHDIISWGGMQVSVDPYYVDKTKAMLAHIEKEIILSRRK